MGTIERVEQAYEQQLETEDGEGSQSSLASIERVSDDLQEKVNQFRNGKMPFASGSRT